MAVNNFTLRQSRPWFFMSSPCCAPVAELGHQPVAAASTQPRNYGHEAKAQPLAASTAFKAFAAALLRFPPLQMNCTEKGPGSAAKQATAQLHLTHPHRNLSQENRMRFFLPFLWLQQWPAPNLNTSGSQNTPSIGSKTVKAKNANEKADIFQPPKS